MSNLKHEPALESIFSWRGVKLILLAWLAMLSFDFFLHGGLLADLYTEQSPFLLPPLEAFKRIPIGYLAFLISAVFLVWILVALKKVGWRSAGATGLWLGAVMWVSLAVGLYSITTASPSLLGAWALGQTVEMGYAGAVVGDGIRRGSLRLPLLITVVIAVVLVAITVAMQSLGLVSSTRL